MRLHLNQTAEVSIQRPHKQSQFDHQEAIEQGFGRAHTFPPKLDTFQCPFASDLGGLWLGVLIVILNQQTCTNLGFKP